MTDKSPVAHFWGDLLRRVSRRTRNHADSEDLLHAAYLRLEQYRKSRPVENQTAFLVHTAANIGIDNYRRQKLQEKCSLDEAMTYAAQEPLQDEVAIARARLKRVKEGLDKLQPRTREIFLMHRLDGMKYREIAEHFEISQSAVEKHIARAALFLTSWMEGW